MSRNSNRLCQLTGSLFLITAGATPASAGLLGGLLGSSTDDSIVQTNQDRDPAKGYFSEPFAEPTIIVDGEVRLEDNLHEQDGVELSEIQKRLKLGVVIDIEGSSIEVNGLA